MKVVAAVLPIACDEIQVLPEKFKIDNAPNKAYEALFDNITYPVVDELATPVLLYENTDDELYPEWDHLYVLAEGEHCGETKYSSIFLSIAASSASISATISFRREIV